LLKYQSICLNLKTVIAFRPFTQLSKNDQRILLARNTPMHIQFGTGFFFGAASVKDQLDQLKRYRQLTTDCKEFSTPPDVNEIIEELKVETNDQNFMDMKRYNSMTKIFRPGSDVDHYIGLTGQIKRLFPTADVDLRAIMSYAMLFDFDGETNFTDPVAVQQIRQEADSFVRSRGVLDNFEKLKSVLREMAAFCAYNISWDDYHSEAGSGVVSVVDDDQNCQFPWFKLVMSYTDEEERWLKLQSSHVDEAFRTVAIGDEMLNEFSMYSLGVPLSRRYMKSVVSITLERMWRVLRVHPEFQELSSQAQREVMAANGPLGLAVMICRYESLCGIQQIREGLGELDETRWAENYLPAFQNLDKVRKMRMKDVVAEMSVTLSQEQLNDYYRILGILGPLVTDPVLYKLLLLLVLLKPLDSRWKIAEPHAKYLMISRRRAEWQCKVEAKSAKDVELKRMIDKLAFYVDNLQQLSKILLFILNKQ